MGGNIVGSREHILRNTVGSCPILDVTVNGRAVMRSLLDSGAEVSTMAESFFRKHLKGTVIQDTTAWLAMTAANGLTIPYVGYIEISVNIANHVIPNFMV